MYFVKNFPFLDFSKGKDFAVCQGFFIPSAACQVAEIRPLFGAFWLCLKSFFLSEDLHVENDGAAEAPGMHTDIAYRVQDNVQNIEYRAAYRATYRTRSRWFDGRTGKVSLSVDTICIPTIPELFLIY